MADNRLEGLIGLLADYGGFDKEYLRDKFLPPTSGEHSETKNKMGLVAAIFGKKIGERFIVERDHNRFDCEFSTCGFVTHGVYENPYFDVNANVLQDLLTGEAVIVDARD